MRCLDVRQYISAFVDGEIDRRREVVLFGHLHACSACRQELERARIIDHLLESGMSSVDPPGGQVAAVMGRLDRETGCKDVEITDISSDRRRRPADSLPSPASRRPSPLNPVREGGRQKAPHPGHRPQSWVAAGYLGLAAAVSFFLVYSTGELSGMPPLSWPPRVEIAQESSAVSHLPLDPRVKIALPQEDMPVNSGGEGVIPDPVSGTGSEQVSGPGEEGNGQTAPVGFTPGKGEAASGRVPSADVSDEGASGGSMVRSTNKDASDESGSGEIPGSKSGEDSPGGAGSSLAGNNWDDTRMVVAAAPSGSQDDKTVIMAGGAVEVSLLTMDATYPGFSPAWSAGGLEARYLTASGLQSGQYSLWRASIDGSAPALLDNNTFGVQGGKVSWSVDSNRFAYFTSGSSGGREMVVKTVGGDSTSFGSAAVQAPAWSPDGKLAFVTAEGYIAVVSPGQARPIILANTLGSSALSWSPDGGRLAYYQGRGERGRLYALQPGSGQVTALSPEIRASSVLSRWSPDGERVAVSAWGSGSDTGLWLFNGDGSSAIRATKVSNKGGGGVLTWSPDAQKLALESADGSLVLLLARANLPYQLVEVIPPSSGSISDLAWSSSSQEALLAWEKSPHERGIWLMKLPQTMY